METPTQLHLIYVLSEIRAAIGKDSNRHNILCKAEEAYSLAFAIPLKENFGYRIEGKERILQMLSGEIRRYSTGTEELEVVKFQLSPTILMLMLQFTKGTLEELMEMTGEESLEERVA